MAAEEIAPYDELSAQYIDRWDAFDDPTPGYVQQCYFMEPSAEEKHEDSILLHNRARNRGIGLKFSTRELPYFTVWKNLQGEGDGYVTGLEPGTCFPNLISFERDQQRVITLPPGGSHRTCLEIDVYDSEAQISASEQNIRRLQKREPTLHRYVHPRYAPSDDLKAQFRMRQCR